ncbi:MAG: hypothetical protein KR126chlam6_00153 [Candidatus Anoxychlamydiales bacterium]|nr:hypothetical protein [Candidatus Anoxychlamydiales bacterium]
MNFKNKFLAILFAVLACNVAFAYDNSQPTSGCERTQSCGCDIPQPSCTSAYNHPANIDVCGSWDFFVTGTFLWWQPRQDQMELAQTLYANQSINVGSIHGLSFDWEPAFKVGAGYNFNWDNWLAYVQYTRVNSSTSSTVNNTVETGKTFHDTWLTQTTDADLQKVVGKWDLNFNIIDLECSRPYYNGKKLTFTTHYGLKGGWIDQKLKIDSSTATVGYSAEYSTDSWLIGPRAGIYTNWNFCEGFRAFGNVAASIFYQKFNKMTYRELAVNDPTQWLRATDYSTSTLSPSLEMLVGFGWESYFANNNWHFDGFVGYETQVYFHQNMLRFHEQISLSAPPYSFNTPGDLVFHGLTVTARVDF